MGDDNWQEVKRKKHRSVFQRLKFSNTSSNNVDDLAKISTSMYVSNFPSHLIVRELWNLCGKAGTLVDVYIAKHGNALGQMFGFCRFIKVSNQDSLINSLSSIWIGKLRLYANVARFNRRSYGKPSHARAQVGKPTHASPKRVVVMVSIVIFDFSGELCLLRRSSILVWGRGFRVRVHMFQGFRFELDSKQEEEKKTEYQNEMEEEDVWGQEGIIRTYITALSSEKCCILNKVSH
nr:RNA-directed DNA polymerase, eukaryota [Tanacetum cinerariifolium]